MRCTICFVLVLAIVSIHAAENASYVPCPNRTFCADGRTCCLLTTGAYGCCPYANALCCSDHVHCCPEGYQCRISQGHCFRGSTTRPLVMKIAAMAELP